MSHFLKSQVGISLVVQWFGFCAQMMTNLLCFTSDYLDDLSSCDNHITAAPRLVCSHHKGHIKIWRVHTEPLCPWEVEFTSFTGPIYSIYNLGEFHQ